MIHILSEMLRTLKDIKNILNEKKEDKVHIPSHIKEEYTVIDCNKCVTVDSLKKQNENQKDRIYYLETRLKITESTLSDRVKAHSATLEKYNILKKEMLQWQYTPKTPKTDASYILQLEEVISVQYDKIAKLEAAALDWSPSMSFEMFVNKQKKDIRELQKEKQQQHNEIAELNNTIKNQKFTIACLTNRLNISDLSS